MKRKDSSTFKYEKISTGEQVNINTNRKVLYAIDIPMNMLDASLSHQFRQGFVLRDVALPGCQYDFNSYNVDMNHEKMGPNVAITRSRNVFTTIYQDGNGDMVSGHYVHAGCNEVISWDADITFLEKEMIFNEMKNGNKQGADEIGQFCFPHTKNNNYIKDIPTKKMLSKLEKRGIYAKCYILLPGDYLHINAGRIHAFRKMGYNSLPITDPFDTLREEMISKHFNAKWKRELFCVSFAWDYLFTGRTQKDILSNATRKWENQKVASNHSVKCHGKIEHPLLSLYYRHSSLMKKNCESSGLISTMVLLKSLAPLCQHSDEIVGVRPAFVFRPFDVRMTDLCVMGMGWKILS